MRKITITKKQISTKLKNLTAAWEVNTASTKLTGTYQFPTFLRGFMFLTKVSVHAEVLGQYPEITLTQHQVKVTLTDLVSKQLSVEHFSFAAKCDEAYLLSTETKTTPYKQY